MFPLASPYSGIVHHLSGPSRYALTQTFLTRRTRSVDDAAGRTSLLISAAETAFTFIAPTGFDHPETCAHVGLLGPCFKTGRMETLGCQRPERVVSAFSIRRSAALPTHRRSRPPGSIEGSTIKTAASPHWWKRHALRRKTVEREPCARKTYQPRRIYRACDFVTRAFDRR